MKTNLLWRSLGASVLGMLLTATSVDAQPTGRPDRVLCLQWTKALEHGGHKARQALLYGWVPGCGTMGMTALSSAITTATTSRDTAFLQLLATVAGHAPDRQVAAAALALAENPAATIEARAMALLTMAELLELPQEFGGISGARLFVEAVVGPAECRPGRTFPAPPSEVPDPIGDEFAILAAHALERIVVDHSSPLLVRNLAGCMRGALDAPVGLDLAGLRVNYVCERYFSVTNPLPVALTLEYSVEGTDESGALELAPESNTEFFTFEEGSLRVTHYGRLLAIVRNERTECP